MSKTKITVAYGDGIGPEIMDATLRILDAAGADLEYDIIEVGEKVYKDGFTSGIKPEAWKSLRDTKVFLKAPITTPQGGGYKSLNVTMRKTLGLFANVRPCKAYTPYVKSHFPKMNLVIIRENEEDLYAGIEHQQTEDVIQCLKLISKPGTEKIVRYAFDYAVANNRKKVTCMTKDNIMKQADGLFHRIFDTVAREYPEIETEHKIIDIGTALVADKPERFDVIVTLNLYGDIISDVAAEVAGSVGMMGSSNVGEQCSMFEAIHGSAPDISGKNIANPSGLINAAVMMLVHLCKADVANKIENAWLKTIEDGIHTGDIYNPEHSSQKAGTREFADAVIARLGQVPAKFPTASYSEVGNTFSYTYKRNPSEKKYVGLDVFVDWTSSAGELGKKIESFKGNLKLQSITNRGLKVYPGELSETFMNDHFQCRFTQEGKEVSHADFLELLQQFSQAGIDFIKTESLCTFNGERAYSLSQGE